MSIYKSGNKWIVEVTYNDNSYKLRCNNKKEALEKQTTFTTRLNLDVKINDKPKKKQQKKRAINKNNKQMIKRKSFTQTDKWSLLNVQEYKCKICKQMISIDGPQYDHIIPLQYKGPDSLKNLQALCIKCHAIKTQKVDNVVMSILIPKYISKSEFDAIKVDLNEKMTNEKIMECQKEIQELQIKKLELSIPQQQKAPTEHNQIVNITNNYHYHYHTMPCDCDIYER